MASTPPQDPAVAAANITRRIRELGGWRGATLARVRQLIHEAYPGIRESLKWEGTPAWSFDGGVCTGEAYPEMVKLTFFRGAYLKDPRGLFNSSLEGNTRRAITLREGDHLDRIAFLSLVRTAVSVNSAARARRIARKDESRPG